MTVIVDYGVGNLFSLSCSFGALGEETVVTADPSVIEGADRIVLPGVGAFSDAMDKLRASGVVPALLLTTIANGDRVSTEKVRTPFSTLALSTVTNLPFT